MKMRFTTLASLAASIGLVMWLAWRVCDVVG